MASKPLLCFAVWTVAVTYGGAAASTLPSEIANLIPSCALDCFESFVSNNYDAAGCGGSPSLSCLCKKIGSSGFTMGEGGVQCLVAEINRQSCQGGDASQQTISQVYAMCSGVPNAAAETHATIVATLVVPSGTGPVQVPGGGSSTASSILTSVPTQTSDTISITPTMTVGLTTSPSSTTKSTATSTPLASTDAGSGPQLNTAQIAGISVAIAATLGLAIGLIFLARCVRRRNFGDQESALFKPRRESKGFGLLKSNQNSPRVLQISAPIHKTPVEMEFRRPGDFRNQRSETIGLALSPPRSVIATATTQLDKAESPRSAKQPAKAYIPYMPGAQVLSPKPTLTLTIPQESRQAQKDVRITQSTRDSVMTEFQEDGEGESVGGSNIWRPPPTDPQSATTYYVADRLGNWSLAKVAELPSPSNKTRAERAMDAMPESPVDKSASAPGGPQVPKSKSAPRDLPMAKLGPPIQFNDRAQVPRSSSVYSNFSLPQSVAPGPENPMPLSLPAPDMYAAANGVARTKSQEGNRRQESKRSSRPSRRKSQDSATTIASSVADAYEEEDIIIETDGQDNLSPVLESPRTPLSPGKSPVSYPKIPTPGQEAAEQRRRQDQKQLPTPPRGPQPALRVFPGPTRNELLNIPTNRLGQPNPTLGAVGVSPLKIQRHLPLGQIPGASKQQLARVPALNPNPPRNPAEIKTGSPEMRTGSAPPEGQRQRRPSPLHQHQRQSSIQQQEQQQQQSRRPDGQLLQGKTGPRSSMSEPHLRGSGLRILLSPTSTTTSGSVDSADSSFLLAKRVGTDRAAALALGDDLGGLSAGRVKWQREQDGPGFVGHDTPVIQPAWLPKLTPTRRGDDLFLNVQ